jgi:hypothetical protein
MADLEQRIIINTQTNAQETTEKVDKLKSSQEGSTDATKKDTKAVKDNSDATEKVITTNSKYILAVEKLREAKIKSEEAEIKLKKATEELSNSQGKSAQQIQQLELNQRKAQLSFDRSTTGLDNATKAVNDNSDSTKKAAKSTNEQKDALGQLSPALGGTMNAIKATGKALLTLAINPIVLTITLIVAGLALLVKAFTSTKAGGEAVDRAIAGISAVIDVLRDRVLKVGEALIKFFSGDFKGAIGTGLEAVNGFGAEVEKEFQQAANATKALQEVTNAVRDLGVSRAKLNRDLAQSKEIITDETASYADKKTAIEDVRKAEAEQTKQEIANAKKKLKSIQELNAQSDTDAENLQKEADAKISLFNLEQKSAEDKRAIRKTEKRADNEEATRLKGLADAKKTSDKIISDARKAIQKERFDAEKKLLQDVQNLQDKSEEQKLSRQKARDLAELSALELKGIDIRKLLTLNTEKYNTLENELKEKRRLEIIEQDKLRDGQLRETDDIKRKEQNERDTAEGARKLEQAKYYSDEQIKIAEAEAQHQKEIEALKRDVLTSGLELVKSLFDKNKKIQKAILITQGIIGLSDVTRDTIRGVSSELAKGVAGIPGAVLIGAKGAINAVGIISSTAKALQAIGGGGGGSIGSVNSGGTQASSSAPQVQFQGSSENQIANSVAQSQQNIQVTVSESDITTAQNNVNTLVKANSI